MQSAITTSTCKRSLFSRDLLSKASPVRREFARSVAPRAVDPNSFYDLPDLAALPAEHAA
jgi:hypothetical protein